MTRLKTVGLAALAFAALASQAWAQSKELNVIGHAVHQRAMGSGEANLTNPWQSATGTKVNWITFDIPALYERLMREASLGETTIDVAFLLNSQANENVFNLLEPLDELQKANPIEDMDDVFPGMVEAMKHDGKLYAIPFRHTPSGLHYNEEYFKERGIAGPPKTVEEMFEYAKKLTYTRADGTKVAGLIFTGNHPANIVDIARAWDGDFLTLKYELAMTRPPMIKAITALKGLFDAGAYPKNFMTLKSDDIDTWMQTGRAAMAVSTISKSKNYNDPKNSQFPGKLKVVNLPISAELAGKYQVAPAKVEFWSMVIPKNSKNKALAWDFIRHVMAKDSILKSALNGNGSVRSSVYERQEYSSQVPWAEVEQKVLKVARVPVPPLAKAPEAIDIFLEGYQAAILGMKSPQAAMDEVASRVKPLLPK